VLLGLTVFGSMVAVTATAQIDSTDGGLGMTATRAGLILVPGSVCLFAGGSVAPRLAVLVGLRGVLTAGSVLAALAMTLMALRHDSSRDLTILLSLGYFGIGLVYAAMPNIIAAATPVARIGEANGVNTLARLLGSAIGAQVITGVLAARSPDTGAASQAFTVLAGAAVATFLFSVMVRVPHEGAL
jgi:MFS family permease